MSSYNERNNSASHLLSNSMDSITFNNTSPSTSSSLSSSSLFSIISQITWQTWIIIILVLALLGFNVFAFLANKTQNTISITEKIFGPILKIFGYTTLTTAKQAIENTAEGTTAGVNMIADSATNVIDQATNHITTPNELNTQNGGNYNNNNNNNNNNNTIMKALNSDLEEQNNHQNNHVMPNDSSSHGKSGQAGWCYIGEDNGGYRTCAQIGVNDMCMSGDIFPSKDICINPNLRA